MGRRHIPLSTWIGVGLLVALSALGLDSAIRQLSSAITAGQRIATATQFGYAVAGLLGAGAALMRTHWARLILWIWAGLITITGGMAPVVWGGARALAGLAAGLASAGIAGLIMWLATRRYAASSV